MNGNVIRTITIRGTQEGLDKLQTDLNKLATAHKNVAIAAEETNRTTLSLEQAWKRQTLRLDEAARAQANIARETKIADRALHEGLATQAQHARQLELINQRYTTSAAGAQTYGKALQQGTGEARLARHEMINLSRQVQDVGVSLASGQSPMTVLIQQGTQIADVFASSSGTLKGFFSQASAGAARFATSWAGIATGAAAIGAGIVYAATSYTSAQREIERALMGIGAASGVTRDQINEIARASVSGFGLSTSQAREAATAFAATGDIYRENVAQATKIIDDFVRAGGDAAKTTEALAEALKNPAAGAVEINKSLGFLNITTLEYIRSLQEQGKIQEAQAALMTAMAPQLEKQRENVSGMTVAWNTATNALDAFLKLSGQGSLIVFEMMTGISAGGLKVEQQLDRARGRLDEFTASSVMAAHGGELAQARMQELRAEVERLEKAVAATGQQAQAFAALGIQADAAARSFLPMRAEIEKVQLALAKLRDYQAQGGAVDQNVLLLGNLRIQQLQQQEGALLRQAQYTQQLAAMYPGMTLEGAKQLQQSQLQLGVAQARTPEEKLTATTIAQINEMLARGVVLEEALVIAATNRAAAEAQVANALLDQKAAEATREREQRDTEKEAKKKAEDAKKADAQREKALKKAAEATEHLTGATQTNIQVTLGANQVYDRLTGHILDYTDSIIFWARTMNEAIDDVLDKMGPSQFKKGGYEFSYDPLSLGRKKQQYEEAGTPYTMKTHGIPGTLGAFQYAAPDFEAINSNLSSLVKSEDELTKSTDRLNETMQDALSPFYSQDPRTTKLGFRAGVTGNPDWATGATNSNPLVAVLGAGATAPGMAEGGSFTVGGGYSANDNKMAVFPVASGEQIVVNRNREGREGRGGQIVNIDNRIIVQGNIDEDTLSKMKVSRFQQAQRMRAGMAQA